MNAPDPDLPAPDRRDAWSAGNQSPAAWDSPPRSLDAVFPSAEPAARGADSFTDSPGWGGDDKSNAPPKRRRPRFPGPGILESLVWAAGFMFTQVLASSVLGALVAFGFFWAGGKLDFSEILRQQQASQPGARSTKSPRDPQPPTPPENLPIVADATPATTPPGQPEEIPASGPGAPEAGTTSPSTPTTSPPTAGDPIQSPGMRALMKYIEQRMPFMLWGAGLATAAYAIVLTLLRLGESGVQELGWHLPRWQHLLAIGLLVLPLSMVASTIQQMGFDMWPSSKQQMESLFEQMRPLPLLMIWAIIAFAPAVSEELLFRGVIGRGLLARYGFVPGVLLTSVFFGGMHLNPAQVMGVIPIGIALHIVYRVTRSFWAPMLLHFLNNAFAGLMLKLSDHPAVQQLGDQHGGGHATLSYLLALGCVGCLFCWMWQTRTEYVDAAGATWEPDQPHCGTPPAHSRYRLELTRELPWGWIAGSLALLAGMLLTMTRSGGA